MTDIGSWVRAELCALHNSALRFRSGAHRYTRDADVWRV